MAKKTDKTQPQLSEPVGRDQRPHVVTQLAAAEAEIARLARENRDIFNAYVLTDSAGASLSPGAIHLSWTDHINRCVRLKKYCAIIAPWGHGKTEQVVIGGALFALGCNPSIRIKIVCNSDDNAKERIAAIKRIIESNVNFQKVFPEIAPDKDRGWSTHHLFVPRPGASKDPSVSAGGVLSSGIGGRYDMIIFDDPVDLKNSVQEPKKRESIKDAIRQIWLSRLDETKKQINYPQVVYIATVWHEDDATNSYVMKNSEFDVLFQSIAEPGMNEIVCQRENGKKTWRIPLWEAKFNFDALRRKRRALGERAYSRGFLNRPYSNDDVILGSVSKCMDYTLTPDEAMRGRGSNWRIISGLDPSGGGREGFAIFTLAVAGDTHVRVPLDMRVGAWSGREPIEQCLDVQRTWNPSVFVVENNAVQDRVREWIQDAGAGEILTQAFQTGRNKADPEAGVPGMDIEFSMGLWCIALGHVDHRDNPDCACAWCRWIKEITYYPMYKTSDLLMASWFAREIARAGKSIDELLDGIKISDNYKRGSSPYGGNDSVRSATIIPLPNIIQRRNDLRARAQSVKW